MKNKVWIIVSFIVGLIIGAAIVCLFCCHCCEKSCNSGCGGKCPMTELSKELQKEPQLIDVPTANKYFHTYLSKPISVDTVRAFTINLEQFVAMGKIFKAESEVHGFRIYYGADPTPDSLVMMVVGVGSPEKNGTIYATSSRGSGLCPTLCDYSSQIAK
jgi:hypothetical protein